MNRRTTIGFILLLIIMPIFFVLDMMTGSTDISLTQIWTVLTGGDCDEMVRRIVVDVRLLQAVSAIVVGVALSVSGQQMQTLFHNPLAGPYVLGVSSGASLGVALFILGVPLTGATASGMFSSVGMAGAAWIGSGLVLVVVAAAGHRFKDIMVVLILGMMFSSGVGAVVQILQYLSNDESLKAFVIWTMGSLGGVTPVEFAIMFSSVFIGLFLALMSVKSLNLLLLGEEYAVTMGLDVRRCRSLLFLSTTLLAGSVTAFCGPVGFIGLAVPHVARSLFATSDHRISLPASFLLGAVVMLVCDIASKTFLLPVNSITSLLGIPVVVWIVLKNKSITC